MAPLGLTFDTVDVFTTTRFTGNQLAIVQVPRDVVLDQSTKQAIAREFNLSETVILHEPPKGTDQAEWVVDIFLTNKEIPFAGHPTVGTACLLGAKYPQLKRLTLKLKAGPVQVVLGDQFSEDGYRKAICDIPHNVHLHHNRLSMNALKTLQPQMSESFAGSEPTFPAFSIVKGLTFVLIEVHSQDALNTAVAPPYYADVKMDEGWETALLDLYFYYKDTELSSPSKRFLHTRMIEPGFEDPATGAAASALSAYITLETYKNGVFQDMDFVITQGEFMGRKSTIELKVTSDGQGSIDKIFLSGNAVPIMSGTL